MSNDNLDIQAALRSTETSLTGYKRYIADLLMAKNGDGGLTATGENMRYPVAPRAQYSEEKGSVTTRTRAGRIFNMVTDMLNSTGICPGAVAKLTELGATGEGFHTSSVDADALPQYSDKFAELCQKAEIEPEYWQYCLESMGTAIYRLTDSSRYKDHFNTTSIDNSTMRGYNTIYPQGVLSDMTFKGAFTMSNGKESFGLNSNTLLPDLKMVITLGLLKTMKGFTNRLMHRVANDSGAVQFVSPNDEFYNLVKSQGSTTDERQGWDHRAQLIHLMTDPSPVNMDLIPVVPLADNDPEHKYLLADGILLPGTTVPLWDMAADEAKIGYERTNYTDLLSGKMAVRGVHLKISDGTNPDEYYFVETSMYPGASMVNTPNTFEDSGDYSAGSLVVEVAFDRDSKTAPYDGSTPEATRIFSGMNASTEYIAVRLNFSAHCNIMSARCYGMGATEIRPVVNTGKDTTTATVDLLNKLKVEIIGWEPDCKYSEENFRKTNMAVRSMLDLYTYPLPDGRTIAHDSSMRQPDDEHMLDVAATVQSIGFDERNLNLINKTLMSVKDRLAKEQSDPHFKTNFGNQTVNRAFVSGRKINPEVYHGQIDLEQVTNFRTSDILSDIREYVRASLNLIVSRMHYRSLYMVNLDGRVPMYNVLTTTPIIECLFSIPSIYPHFMPNGVNGEEVFQVKSPGRPLEYVTKLPCGTVLRFVSTTFRKMDNTMLIIPFVENDPASDLNYAINYDGGQFSVTFNPVDMNAVNRRTLVNYREMPITLCPIGGIVRVKGMKKFFPDIEFIGHNSTNP